MLKLLSKLCLASSCLAVSSAYALDQLLIEDITIVSAHLDAPKIASVLIEDGKILKVGSSFEVSNPQIIDGTGKFLSYGIMDAHVHVSAIPGIGFGSEPLAQANADLAEAFYEQQPKSLLYYGVTQILDPNPGVSYPQFTKQPIRPDYFRCEVITTPNTFPFVEKEAAISERIYPQVLSTPLGEKDFASSIHTKISNLKDDGAICIKLYFENGYGDNDQWPLMAPKFLEAIHASAKELELPLLAHANAIDMYAAAVSANVDLIVHGLWNWGSDNKSRSVPTSVHNILKQLKENDIAVMPSFRVMAGLAELMKEDNLNQKIKGVSPTALTSWYASEEAQWFKKEVIQGFDNLAPEQIFEIIQFAHLRRGSIAFAEMQKKEINIILGSDTPGSPTYANQPGLNTYQEIQMMHAAGIGAEELFKIATYKTPAYFQLDDQFGTIEEGKIANLLILQKSPQSSVEAWDSIEIIILHGEVLQREDLKVD